MRGDLLNGSAIKNVLAASPVAFNSAGSSNPVNLGKFTHGTLIVAAGSISTGYEAHVMRSGTSNGTFQSFGASAGLNSGTQLVTRNFAIDTSAIWHRVYYTNGVGSAIAAVVLQGRGAYHVPINQESNVTVLSDVSNA